MLDIDLVMAILHHLSVFTLVGIVGAEFVLLRPGLSGARLFQLAAIDRAYGGIAGLVVVVGIVRVIFGASGWEYYVANWVFWAKMIAFIGTGLLSVQPTRALLAWSAASRADAAFVPPADAIARSRRFVNAQVVLFVLIPIFAAAMARGYGS